MFTRIEVLGDIATLHSVIVTIGQEHSDVLKTTAKKVQSVSILLMRSLHLSMEDWPGTVGVIMTPLLQEILCILCTI